MCYPCHRTLPQLPQFSILMNLYFVYVINIRFICDGAIYLLTSAKKIYKEQLTLKSSIQWYHMTESDVIKNRYSQYFMSCLCWNQLYQKQTFKLISLKVMFEILTVSESNLDDSFSESQFLIEGFGTSICLVRNRNMVGELCFSFQRSAPPKFALRIRNLLKVFMKS